MLAGRNYHVRESFKTRIVEKYECSAGENEEITITLAVDDVILGETEIVLEHKKEKEM